MMKMAITVWGDLISPVFDSANTLLIVETENKLAKNRHLESFNSAKPSLLMERLIEQEVSVLICGAISEFPAHLIENSSLELIPFISGNVDQIVDKFLSGVSLLPMFQMPGCGCNRHGCQKTDHAVPNNRMGSPRRGGAGRKRL